MSAVTSRLPTFARSGRAVTKVSGTSAAYEPLGREIVDGGRLLLLDADSSVPLADLSASEGSRIPNPVQVSKMRRGIRRFCRLLSTSGPPS